MNASPDIDHSRCVGHALVQHLDNPDFGLRPALHVQLRWTTDELFKNLAKVGRVNMVPALRLEEKATQGLPGLFAWPSTPGEKLDLLAVDVSARKLLLEWLSRGFRIANELLRALEPARLSEGIGVCLYGEAQPVIEEVRKLALRPQVVTETLFPGWAAFPEPDWEVTRPPRTPKTTHTGRN